MNNTDKLIKIREHKALIKSLYSKRFSTYSKDNKEQVRYFKQCREESCNQVFNTHG